MDKLKIILTSIGLGWQRLDGLGKDEHRATYMHETAIDRSILAYILDSLIVPFGAQYIMLKVNILNFAKRTILKIR